MLLLMPAVPKPALEPAPNAPELPTLLEPKLPELEPVPKPLELLEPPRVPDELELPEVPEPKPLDDDPVLPDVPKEPELVELPDEPEFNPLEPEVPLDVPELPDVPDVPDVPPVLWPRAAPLIPNKRASAHIFVMCCFMCIPDGLRSRRTSAGLMVVGTGQEASRTPERSVELRRVGHRRCARCGRRCERALHQEKASLCPRLRSTHRSF